jgi:hypothetical protein
MSLDTVEDYNCEAENYSKNTDFSDKIVCHLVAGYQHNRRTCGLHFQCRRCTLPIEDSDLYRF